MKKLVNDSAFRWKQQLFKVARTRFTCEPVEEAKIQEELAKLETHNLKDIPYVDEGDQEMVDRFNKFQADFEHDYPNQLQQITGATPLVSLNKDKHGFMNLFRHIGDQLTLLSALPLNYGKEEDRKEIAIITQPREGMVFYLMRSDVLPAEMRYGG